jgi:NAD(P)-dependent dehydrogenase (short-subunit alcohol dehydrogenase family)
MSGRLQGLKALVTGAAGGIGGAIAARFAEEGAVVVATDRAGTASPCDVTDEAALERLIAASGPFDVLAHAAALTGGTGRFPEVTTADFERYLATNLTGAFLVARAVARGMIAAGKPGRLVLIGSIDGLAAEPEAAPYVASKSGLLGLARAIAVDLAPHRIACNLIAPGPIEVARNRALFASEPLRSGLARAVPLGGAGTPAAVAEAALFLADPRTSFVTGTTLTVDGGLLAQIRQV